MALGWLHASCHVRGTDTVQSRDDLDHPERPRAGEEAVGAREGTADREREDETSVTPFECVHQHHERERSDSIDRNLVHDEDDDKYVRRAEFSYRAQASG